MVANDHPQERRDWKWAGCLAACILASRLHVAAFSGELNVDESLFLAQARRFATDLVPWRGADCTTSGPVTSWFLLLVHQIGVPISFAAAHALAAVVVAATVVLTMHAASRAFGPRAGRFAATLATVWIVARQTTDFLHFSSELLPNLWMAAALALATTWSGDRTVRIGLVFTAGFLVGLVPWTKLQAGPVGFVLGLGLLASLMKPRWFGRADERPAWGAAAALCTGALVPAGVIMALVITGGAWLDFFNSYILGNLAYGGSYSRHGFGLISGMVELALGTEPIAPWMLGIAGFSLWTAFASRREKGFGRLAPDGWAVLAWLLALTALAVSVRPGTGYPHYQWLMMPPFVLVTAALVAGSQMARPSAGEGQGSLVASRIRIVIIAIAGIYASTQCGQAVADFRKIAGRKPNPDPSLLLASALHEAPGFQSILVWGWMPSLYVEGGLIPPSRHAIPHYLLIAHPGRDRMRATFVRDLRTNPPDVIVLTIGIPDSLWKEDEGFYPELDQFVKEQYVKVDPARLLPFRALRGLYVRKDFVPQAPEGVDAGREVAKP